MHIEFTLWGIIVCAIDNNDISPLLHSDFSYVHPETHHKFKYEFRTLILMKSV
jgi:hypothetical protein